MINADRNLLFGILALQLNFIDRDELIAAMHAWVLDKQRSLSEILVERGQVSYTRQALLETLVDEHLKTHGDIEQSLWMASRGDPSRLDEAYEELLRLEDRELQDSVARIARPVAASRPEPELGAAGRTAPLSEETVGPDRGRTLGGAQSPAPRPPRQRFDVLREHARGGLGRVSVALDRELNREVALKEILPECADDPQSHSRFVQEAEITGRLEHPGVVPVYSLGHSPGGPPYYAMRFVRGESLKDAIEKLHREKPQTQSQSRWNLALRELLNRFVAVCNVIAYAHSRGVIHRDLKPSNILLGSYGETLVVDWGLAKPIGRQDRVVELAAGEATVKLNPSSSATETAAGTAIGTPAFMSPEQARGELERIGPQSDVYSLGATFYTLLTGRMPFRDRDVAQLLAKVQQGDFPRPRAVDPWVPAGLEAVCLKAMALDPRDRYASPRALADDLERWLADEPVSVHRESLSTRLTRWGRRHRTVAVGIGALLVTTAVALAVSTLLIGFEKARTEAQRNLSQQNFLEASRQRDLAKARSLELSRQAEALEKQLYVNRITLAQRELSSDLALCQELLNQCPPHLRDWEWHCLRRMCHQELRVFRDHTHSVNAVAISPDGQLLASGDGPTYTLATAADSGVVIVREFPSGRELRRFGPIQGTVNRLVFSPDSKTLACASGWYGELAKIEGAVTLYDVETGREIFRNRIPLQVGLCVAFSPDGSMLAAGLGRYSDLNFSGCLKIWETSGGREILSVSTPPGSVNNLAFSPDGATLAWAGAGLIELWETRPPQKRRELRGHTDWIYSLAFSPDSKQLASAGWDKSIKLWDLESGQAKISLEGHEGFITGLRFLPDGSRLVSASSDQTLRLWSVAEGQSLYTLRGHTQGILGLDLAPGGSLVATGSEDRTLRTWRLTREPPGVVDGRGGWVNGADFTPGGQRVAVGSADGTVAIHDLESGASLLETDPKVGWISGVAISPDAHLLAAATEYGGVRVWKAATGEAIRTLDTGQQFCRGVAFSADGSTLAACTGNHDFQETRPGRLFLWDAATGKPQRVLEDHQGRLYTLAFSPDSQWIAAAGGPGALGTESTAEILIWHAATGRLAHRLSGHAGAVRDLEFSRDGRQLISGGDDSMIRIWDWKAATLTRTIPTGADGVLCLSINPQGTRIAFGNLSRVVRLLDAVTGERILSLQGHTSGVVCLAFSADGKRLASGSIDRTARIWDATPLPPEAEPSQPSPPPPFRRP